MNRQIKTAVEMFQEQERLDASVRAANQLEKIAVAAQEQADAAKKQADLAKKESESAKTEAFEAKRQSKINTWIAVAAVVVAVLSWLVPREAVYIAIRTFFQLL